MEAYSSSSSYMQATKGPSGSSSRQSIPNSHPSSLHSVRKSLSSSQKPWRKPSVAPLPPTPPRVYKVDPINFRDLVQSLTSAPEFLDSSLSSTTTTTLQSIAPSPLDINRGSAVSLPSAAKSTPFSAMYKDLSETLEIKTGTPHNKVMPTDHNSMVDSSYLRLNLSPSSNHHWFSFPLLSPGTLSSLEQSTVL